MNPADLELLWSLSQNLSHTQLLPLPCLVWEEGWWVKVEFKRLWPDRASPRSLPEQWQPVPVPKECKVQHNPSWGTPPQHFFLSPSSPWPKASKGLTIPTPSFSSEQANKNLNSGPQMNFGAQVYPPCFYVSDSSYHPSPSPWFQKSMCLFTQQTDFNTCSVRYVIALCWQHVGPIHICAKGLCKHDPQCLSSGLIQSCSKHIQRAEENREEGVSMEINLYWRSAYAGDHSGCWECGNEAKKD